MNRKRLLLVLPLVAFFLGACLLLQVARAGERFTDNGDGTVTDHQLGVMWAKYDNQGDIDWKGAERYCKLGPPQLLGKYDNWRMPTLAELKSLYVPDKNYKGYETDCGQWVKVVPEIRLSCGWVWSGEKRSITARVFNFRRGYDYTDRMVHKRHYRALPVRDLETKKK
ncbi:MAG: hypothetical protein DRG83_12595 [Deltaproteobacteria bacterium]|nr:MAG: hypothetical protein DRG83_12595 [Deltaproteobacteria bacterium]